MSDFLERLVRRYPDGVDSRMPGVVAGEVFPLIAAIDDLHACMNRTDWDDLQPETQELCLQLHELLHHASDEQG